MGSPISSSAWRGRIALGGHAYEVLDTKLARRAKPAHALQLCFYSSAVARIQGVEPEVAHIVLGTSERHTIRLADVSAYYRRLCRQFEASVGARLETAPYPVDHCSICNFRRVCEARWDEEDHLVRVAGIRRDQIERLAGIEVVTLTGLAGSAADLAVPKLRADTFAGLREQAGFQRDGEIEISVVRRLGRWLYIGIAGPVVG